MTVEELEDLKHRYKVIEAKRINDDIVSVDLFHDEEKSNYLHIKLLFAYGKLYYTGDFGTYVFGKDIQNIFNFFKGVRFDESYWQEKCEAASDPIIPDEVDLEKVEKAVRDYLEENEIEITDDIEEEISDCFCYMDSNAYRAYDKVEELFRNLDLFYYRVGDIIRAGQGYHGRFIYACEVIQWVSNNLDEWLGENKNGRSV